MMKKQQEIALLREYAQLRDVYEQTNTFPFSWARFWRLTGLCRTTMKKFVASWNG